MTKRKINVDKLSDEQLQIAQAKIYDTIKNHINTLTHKWNQELNKYGKKCIVEASIDTEEVINEALAKKETTIPSLKSYGDDKLDAIASDLNRIAAGMNEDLESSVTSCNELLNRYGLACIFGFTSQSISD